MVKEICDELMKGIPVYSEKEIAYGKEIYGCMEKGIYVAEIFDVH